MPLRSTGPPSPLLLQRTSSLRQRLRSHRCAPESRSNTLREAGDPAEGPDLQRELQRILSERRLKALPTRRYEQDGAQPHIGRCARLQGSVSAGCQARFGLHRLRLGEPA